MAKRKRKSKKWIQGAIKRPGSFTRKAKRRGLTAAAFQAQVLSSPKRYSTSTVRQARLRKTLVGKRVRRRRSRRRK